MTATANTEIYTNIPVWYPQGMKITISHPKSGKQMEGVTIKTPMQNYMDFAFFDIRDYNKQDAQILITPILQNATGTIKSSEGSLDVNFDFQDTGLSGKCPIKVTYEDGIAHNIQVELVLKDKTVAKEFGRTRGSNSHDAVCADLIDGKIAVISKTTSWFTQSIEIAQVDLNGANGHSITIHISNVASSVLQ